MPLRRLAEPSSRGEPGNTRLGIRVIPYGRRRGGRALAGAEIDPTELVAAEQRAYLLLERLVRWR
ncbi:hypothetical protein [Streptomyces sp. Ncost-T10-10d]|uniref:hypothetical protein n=1 Tax=Streptomyces sp. Ncost-T10-10d TaxID=1839774 RepID=UPI00114CD61B|nr:hypothetical protein [Streptomyces sp. Ncost-T10-10d]